MEKIEDFFAIEQRLMTNETLRKTMADYHELIDEAGGKSIESRAETACVAVCRVFSRGCTSRLILSATRASPNREPGSRSQPCRSGNCQPSGSAVGCLGRTSGERTLYAPKRSRKMECRSDARRSPVCLGITLASAPCVQGF